MNRMTTTVLVLAASLIATVAHGNVDDISIGSAPYATSTPTIRVVNDMTQFTEVQGSTEYHASGSVDCSGTHKVQQTLLGVGRFNIGDGFNEAAPHQVFDTSLGGTGGGSTSVNGSVSVPADQAHLGTLGVYQDPVDMCNAGMRARAPTPHERVQLLHDGFEMDAIKQVSFAARCRWDVASDQQVSWAQASMDVPVKIACEGNPAVQLPAQPTPEPDELVRKFEIRHAHLFVDPVAEGYCVKGFDVPVEIQITSNGVEGDASFRFGHNGAWGGVTNLHFTEFDDVFRHQVMLRIPPADMGADGDLADFRANPGSAGPVHSMASAPSQVHTLALKILKPEAKVWDTETVSIRCTPPKLNPIIGGTQQELRLEPRTPVAPTSPTISNAPTAPIPAVPRKTGKAARKPGMRQGTLKLN